MSNNYLSQADTILKNLNIKVKNINRKSEIKQSKSFSATLTPSLQKIVIK